MANKRKKLPKIYVKDLSVCSRDQDFEQMVKAKMAQTGLPTESAAIRYLLENRRVETHVVQFSLDSAMWVLSDIQKELQLLHIDIMQIKKKLAEITIMHSSAGVIDTQLFDDLKAQLEPKENKIFDTITKLSYLWLPK